MDREEQLAASWGQAPVWSFAVAPAEERPVVQAQPPAPGPWGVIPSSVSRTPVEPPRGGAPAAPPLVPHPELRRPGTATAAVVLTYVQAGSLLLGVVLLAVLAASVTLAVGAPGAWWIALLVAAVSLVLGHALGALFLWRGTGRQLLVASVWVEIGLAVAVVLVVARGLGLGGGTTAGVLLLLVPYSVLPVVRSCLASTRRVKEWISWRRQEIAAGRVDSRGRAMPWVLTAGTTLCAALAVLMVLLAVPPSAEFGVSNAAGGAAGVGGSASRPSGTGSGSTANRAVSGAGFTASIAVPDQSPDGVDAAGAPTEYSWPNLLDQDPATCWRMPGDGAGRTIELTFSRPVQLDTLGLINGYAKVDPHDGSDRYQQERRILTVTWVLDDGTTLDQQLSDGDRGLQEIDVPLAPSTRTLQLTITTTTVAGDPNFDYTAISELTVSGR